MSLRKRIVTPMKRRLFSRLPETAAALLLLAAQLALGTSVHHHASNVFEGFNGDESASPREVHEVVCGQPTASHWHRDRVVEVEPCLACLLQHLVGVRVHAPRRPVLAVAMAGPEWLCRPAIDGFRLDTFPRGPPALV